MLPDIPSTEHWPCRCWKSIRFENGPTKRAASPSTCHGLGCASPWFLWSRGTRSSRSTFMHPDTMPGSCCLHPEPTSSLFCPCYCGDPGAHTGVFLCIWKMELISLLILTETVETSKGSMARDPDYRKVYIGSQIMGKLQKSLPRDWDSKVIAGHGWCTVLAELSREAWTTRLCYLLLTFSGTKTDSWVLKKGQLVLDTAAGAGTVQCPCSACYFLPPMEK